MAELYRVRRPEVLAWIRLARVCARIDRCSAAHMQDAGLSLAQFDVLVQVGAADGLSQQELADRLLVTKGNVTQVLHRMERDGLICRRREGHSKLVFLTEQGRRARTQLLPDQEARIAAQFAALSEEEQRTLHALLRKLDRALDPGSAPFSPIQDTGDTLS